MTVDRDAPRKAQNMRARLPEDQTASFMMSKTRLMELLQPYVYLSFINYPRPN